MSKSKYYSLEPIKEKQAQYNLVFGERSNGKTYAGLEEILKQTALGYQGAIIRRYDDDLKASRGSTMFNGLVENGLIEKYTNGVWTSVYYRSKRWYFCKWDEQLNKNVIAEDPFCYGFSLTTAEHDKSTSFPKVNTIVFDEFITRDMYLPNEFMAFTSVISTIVRSRKNVTIYMFGNTVNMYCPYFKEMGLKHIREMKQGDIDVYTYGNSDLKVAVEYAESSAKKGGKESDSYFAFNNPKLKMITSGVWELALYPHLPCKYKPQDILFTYFIIWEDIMYQCEIISTEDNYFTYIHKKTTPLKDLDNDLIYSIEYSSLPNWRRKITKPRNEIENKIFEFFITEKVFYQDNEIGEAIRNYLQWCVTDSMIER